jgi:ABC-type transport system involved in multi-copper enzyme maturation permease subunit
VTQGDVPTAVGRDPGAVRTFLASVSAIGVKELRWRMRGRRAFVVVTVHVLLLGLVVFGLFQLLYENAVMEARWRFGEDGAQGGLPGGLISGAVSATIGQALFSGLLVVMTVLTLIFAPALASGAISMEREKQTLELLVTTPISTLGMLVAKLIASLAYVFLLIVASIPLMSIVFAFGGVGPEDLVRAYVLLLAVAFGIGAVGLFMSALVGRSQIATVLSYVVVLALTLGSLGLHTYLVVTTVPEDDRMFAAELHEAPEALLWLNPFVADIDVVCTAIADRFPGSCSYISLIGHRDDGADPPRDAFWPRSALAFLIFGGVLTLLSTQLIAPSRRLQRSHRTRAPDDPDKEPLAVG